MKGCLKIVSIVLGLALIVLALGAIALVTQADRYTKGILERALSYAIGAEVKVDKIRLQPLRQTMEISGLTLFSPAEFRKGPAVEIEQAVARFDVRTLFSRTPTIREILVRGARVHLRYELGEGTNLGALAKRAAACAKILDAQLPWLARRTFLVKEMRCETVKMSASTNLIPLASADLDIAPFTLNNVSRGPMSLVQVTSVFLRSLQRETLSLKGLLSPVMSLLQKESSDEP